MTATSSQLCLDDPPAGRVTGDYCPAATSRVSVRGVGGTDAVLAARLTAGDDYALAELFDALGRSVYGSALAVLGDDSAAQDVVQDVFVELWSHPDRYDPAAGTLRTYLTVLARHRAVDVIRSELRRVARQERSYRLTPMTPAPDPAAVTIVTDTVGFCRLAANRLTPAELDVCVTGEAGRAADVLAAATTLALD